MTDYELFLAEYNLTDAEMAALAEFGYVLTDDPVYLAPSDIHGTGVFAAQSFVEGELVCLAQANGKRTQGGRYTNHAAIPNTIVIKIGDDLALAATRLIEPGEEITLDYRQAIKESGFQEMRDKIKSLEAEIEHMPQADCPVRHHFAPGVYAREMTIPAGVLLTGAVHKTSHLSVLSAGRIIIIDGMNRQELAAPATVLSAKGVKRAIYALETAVWTTFHATNETNLDKLVEELTESTSAELLGGSANKQMAYMAAQQVRG